MVLPLALASGAAGESSRVLRIATVAPDGSEWAKAMKAAARDLDVKTQGRLKLKIYFGGIAGSEVAVGERIKRGQLDGAFSGGMLCERAMASMRVLRLLGVFQSRDEAAHIMKELAKDLEAEAQKSGYTLLGTAGIGPDIVFSKTPVKSFSDLRKLKMWHWDIDLTASLQKQALGWQIVSLPIEQAAKALDDGRADSVYAIPAAALTWQWYTRLKYALDLPFAYLHGCVLIANRAIDPLPAEQQEALRRVGQSLVSRFETLGQRLDKKLLGGVFQSAGLQVLKPSESLRAEFFAQAREARENLGEKLLPRPLLDRVFRLLADYRAEHGSK